MAQPDPNPNLTRFVQARLAEGRNVLFADAHISVLPRQILSNPELLAAVSRNKGTLILEGPQSGNRIVQDFYAGKLTENQLRAMLAATNVYLANNRNEAQKWSRADADVFVHAKAAHTPVFFPETGTGYDALRKDPEGAEFLDRLTGNVTSLRCTSVQMGAMYNAFTPHDIQIYKRIAPIVENRDNPEENNKIIRGISARPGPYVMLYGDMHRALLAKGLGATSVSFIASKDDKYVGETDIMPDYVYFAKEDELMPVPKDPAQLAAFKSKYVGEIIKDAHSEFTFGAALTNDEKKACIDALPPSIRNKTREPRGL